MTNECNNKSFKIIKKECRWILLDFAFQSFMISFVSRYLINCNFDSWSFIWLCTLILMQIIMLILTISELIKNKL